jgi:hypothetical protein
MAKVIKKSATISTGAVVSVVVTDDARAFLHFKKQFVEGEKPPSKVWDAEGFRNTVVGMSVEALAAVYQLIGEHLRKSDAESEVSNG